MVRESKEVRTYFVCEVCDRYHKTRQEAVDCELTVSSKKPLYNRHNKSLEWEVGDFILLGHHDRNPILAKVVGTNIKEHDIIPSFEILGEFGWQTYSTFQHEWVNKLDSNIEKQVLQWALEIIHKHDVDSPDIRDLIDSIEWDEDGTIS